MSTLEDRLLRIMELRSAGKDERAIAEALEITPALVVQYEKSLESSLHYYVSQRRKIEDMATALDISPVFCRTALSYLGIQYPYPPRIRGKVPGEVVRIRQSIAEGAKSVDEIAQQVKLRPGSVLWYTRRYHIPLPYTRLEDQVVVTSVEPEEAVSAASEGSAIANKVGDHNKKREVATTHRPIRERIIRIREVAEQGAASVEEIAQTVGLAPETVRNYASDAKIKLPRKRPMGVTRKEHNLEAIRQALAEGIKSPLEIAQRTRLSPRRVLRYLSTAGISLPGERQAIMEGTDAVDVIAGADSTLPQALPQRRGNSPTTEQLDVIRQARGKGKSFREIAQLTGLAPETVRVYAYKAGFLQHHEEVSKIESAVQQGIASLDDLCTTTGLTVEQVKRVYRHRDRRQLPAAIQLSLSRRPEIDAPLEEGKAITEMAKAAKISRQAVDQYLKRTGQHKAWKEKRREVKQAKQTAIQAQDLEHFRFCSVLKARANQSAEEKGWAYQKAWEYRSSLCWLPEDAIPFKSLLTLFRRYERAKEKEEKLSLEELAEGLFTPGRYAGHILERVGIEPMHWTFERHLVHYEKKLAINRAARYLPRISCADIGYFLDLPRYIVSQHPAMKEKKRGKESGTKRIIKMFSEGKGKVSVLTYRLSSQIYKAKAAGFNQEETAELLDTTPQIVQYAHQHRQEIAPVIERTLRVLYPNEKVSRPYRTNKS